MKAERAKAGSLAGATLIPAAAAARSLERTAMSMRPVAELRSRATRSPTSTTITRRWAGLIGRADHLKSPGNSVGIRPARRPK
jgi:hypothetical protein